MSVVSIIVHLMFLFSCHRFLWPVAVGARVSTASLLQLPLPVGWPLPLPHLLQRWTVLLILSSCPTVLHHPLASHHLLGFCTARHRDLPHPHLQPPIYLVLMTRPTVLHQRLMSWGLGGLLRGEHSFSD